MRQGDIFRFLKENQRASFDPLLLGSGCVASPISSILLLLFPLPFISFARFSPSEGGGQGAGGDDSVHQREVR